MNPVTASQPYRVTFNNRSPEFFNALKSAVDRYFEQTGRRRTGDWRLYLKTAVLVTTAVGLYFLLLFVPMHAAVAIPLCVLLGMAMTFVGFNVMHDACHGSYSSRKWVNEVFGLTHNFLGGNASLWKLKHNIVHHTYTNVDGVDDDINNMPFMRECSSQPWKPIHRYQAVYMFFLYGFTSLFMFGTDYLKYFSRRIHTTPIKHFTAMDHILFWVGKVFFIFVYIVIPILVVGWKPWLIGFAVVQFSMGLTLALTFQLAHVVEHAEFDVAGTDPKRIENEWAIHQVKTTANFAMANRVVTWLLGGLNHQIEHHLFPRVSHVHYPALSRIVKETCHRFDLDYMNFPTTRSAIASHYRFMREMGRKP